MSSSFKKRLRQLHGSRARRKKSREQTSESRVFTADNLEAGECSAGDTSTRHGASPIVEKWRSVGAKSRPSGRGPAHYLVRSHRQGHAHGDIRLVDGARVDLASFGDHFNDSRLHTLDPNAIGFVDLETNGLAKSCYPFCIGIGVWEGASFAVYHFFMPTDKDEGSALAEASKLLRKCKGLCTFNGSSFDIPKLLSRLSHHDIDHDLDELAHIDLLHLSRKLLPGRDSHKLSRLEEDVLGFRRHDDVPGAEIPGRWRRYLDEQDPELLLDVFEHNRFDILSMVVLLARLADELEAPGESAAPTRRSQPRPTTDERGAVGSKLARTYRLRDKTKKRKSTKEKGGARARTDGDDDGDPADKHDKHDKHGQQDRVRLEASFSRAQLRKGMPVGGRLRELRGRVERLLEQRRDDEAMGLLHEMVALSPRHPYALEKLIEQHRRAGRSDLAEHYQKRLADTAPY